MQKFRVSFISLLVGYVCLVLPSNVAGFSTVSPSFLQKSQVGVDNVVPTRTLHKNSLWMTGSSQDGTVQTYDCKIDDEQSYFTKGYLNKHHGDLLTSFVVAFTPIGATQKKKNAFSGGSYKILGTELESIQNDTGDLILKVRIQIRGEKQEQEETVTVPLDAVPNGREFKSLPFIPPPLSLSPNHVGTSYNAVDDFVRRLNRLCVIVNRPDVTGKLIQMGIQIGGDKVGYIKNDLYLNQVPHNRFVRQYFYDMASKAILDSVILCSEKKISNRMKVTCMFPELNPSMDSYRIGTLLELTRFVAITLAEQNLRVRICVQGSMGVGIFTGIPKQLSGVSTLLSRMDWQSGPGEENEGMVGNYVNFGAIGKEHVMNRRVDSDGNTLQEQDDVFILLCPQSMVGVESSIMGALSEMTDAVGDRPIILVNPDLTDKVSSQGQQNVRGRQERIDFANSFETIYHFQNIYVSGTSYFPILGSVCKFGPDEPWVAHQRRDLVDGGEVYIPMLSGESQPDGELILNTFE